MKSKKHYGAQIPGQNKQHNQMLLNKKSKELARYGYGKVIHKTARQRDIWGLIAIITFICLLVSLYFNFRAYWATEENNEIVYAENRSIFKNMSANDAVDSYENLGEYLRENPLITISDNK